jgi:hypothetical protein
MSDHTFHHVIRWNVNFTRQSKIDGPLDVHFVNPSPVLHLDKAGDCGHHQRMKMSVLPDSRQGPLPCQYLMLPQ